MSKGKFPEHENHRHISDNWLAILITFAIVGFVGLGFLIIGNMQLVSKAPSSELSLSNFTPTCLEYENISCHKVVKEGLGICFTWIQNIDGKLVAEEDCRQYNDSIVLECKQQCVKGREVLAR